MSDGDGQQSCRDRQAAVVAGSDAIGANAERLTGFQSDFAGRAQRINQRRLERTQSEVDLAAEIASKMVSARTLPDAAAVHREWASRRMKFATEDANYVRSAGKELMEAGSCLLPIDGKGRFGST